MRSPLFYRWALTVCFGTCAMLILSGCKSANVTKFVVADSVSNREKVTQLVSTVARDFEFRESSEQYDTVVPLAGYEYHGDEANYLISLGAVADIRKTEIRTGLYQVKTGTKRTSKYLAVQNRLETDFKKAFGDDVKISSYNDTFPFW